MVIREESRYVSSGKLECRIKIISYTGEIIMNKKRIFVLILSIVVVLMLVGCGNSKKSADREVQTSSAENLNENSTVKDNKDKKQEELDAKDNEKGERVETQGISVIYPSGWKKVKADGDDVYILDERGTNVNLTVESMKGYSEEQYNKASDIDVRTNLHVNDIQVKEANFNNKKARVTYYVQKNSRGTLPTCQVTFLHNNTAYIFTIAGTEKISGENIKLFENMLNTVEFTK
jgi:hypothetical protein